MKILFLAFLSMDYVIYNYQNDLLGFKTCFFLIFKVHNLAFCFYFAFICVLNIFLTFSIRLNMLCHSNMRDTIVTSEFVPLLNLSHAKQ